MDMELFPALGFGWLYGWVLIAIWLAIQGLSVLLVPKDVRERLFEFDRSSWSKRHRILFASGKMCGLVYLVLAAFTPIKIGSIEFIIGLVVYLVGLSGLVKAVYDFKITPLDRPVAIGLYRVSRHPQLVMLFILGIGLSISLSSWTLLLIRILAFGLEHSGVLAEEQECVKRFGESYREYMESVPRYLII